MQIRKNPDGSTTYIDTSTGASRTFGADGNLKSQNYGSYTSSTTGKQLASPDPAVERARSEQASKARIDYAPPISSGGGMGDLERMLQQALQQQGSSQDYIRELERIIGGMRPEAPPKIDIDAATQSAMNALNPLLEQSRAQITRDSDAYRRAVQSQIAQSGIYGDSANRALAEAERTRQEAMGNLSAAAQAQIADQAMRLLGLEQGRYSSQQDANAAMAQIALALGQGAFGQANQGIQNLLAALGTQGQLGLGQEQLRQQGQLAMLPYTNVRPEFLLQWLLGIRDQGSGMALR